MKSTHKAYCALLWAQFSWSMSNIGMSHAIGESSMPPLQFAFLRELYSSMLMAMLALHNEGIVIPARGDVCRILVCGTLGTFVPHTLYLIGMLLTSPNIAAIYTPMVPVIGGVLAVATGTESYTSCRLVLKWVLSIASVCAGALCIIRASAGEAHHSTGHALSSPIVGAAAEQLAAPAVLSPSILLGNVCLLGNVSSFACFLFLQKDLLTKYPPMTLTAWGFTVGMLELGILALASGQLGSEAATVVSMELGLVLGFTVLVGTVLNYNLYTWANSVLPSSTVSLFHGTNPVFTAVLSHFLLFTEITPIHVVGGVMILVGLHANMQVKKEGLLAQGCVSKEVLPATTGLPMRKALMKDF